MKKQELKERLKQAVERWKEWQHQAWEAREQRDEARRLVGEFQGQIEQFHYWAAKHLGQHVDNLAGLSLVEVAELVAAREAEPRFSTVLDRDTIADAVRGARRADSVPGRQGFVLIHETRLIETLSTLADGHDPAVLVRRESELPVAKRDEDGNWLVNGEYMAHRDTSVTTVRGWCDLHLDTAARQVAVARAIEAEQKEEQQEQAGVLAPEPVDPVDVFRDQIRNQADTIGTLQGDRNEALRLRKRAERERDAAVARAAAAERERDALDDRLAQVDMELSQAVAAPVVSRADIEKAIQPYVWPHHLDGATDEIWALLDERAEQAVDPVEELAIVLNDAAKTTVPWSKKPTNVQDIYRQQARAALAHLDKNQENQS